MRMRRVRGKEGDNKLFDRWSSEKSRRWLGRELLLVENY